MSKSDTRGRILVIEDDMELARALQDDLGDQGYTVETVGTAEAGIARAREAPFDVLVTDFQMPGLSGMDLIKELHPRMPQVPIILITGQEKTEKAVIDAIKHGAYDYVFKPITDWNAFLDLIKKALATGALAHKPGPEAAEPVSEPTIVGRSSAMQKVFKEIGRVALRPVTVLIRGETGTGKELIARAVHQHSDRADQPFVIVNCVAIPETLLESELFGHEQGAFTGAQTPRIGKFEQAGAGTVFLDEIGDLSPTIQAKFLRVLQEKTFQRLGGKEPIALRARILAATHRDLEQATREKKFREDLYYRLNDAVIHLPPLRERREDIPALVRYFLSQHQDLIDATRAAISPEALGLLQHRPWPGNVRELRNVVQKALLLAHGYTITPEILQQALGETSLSKAEAGESLPAYVADLLERAERNEAVGIESILTEWAERQLYSQAFELAQGDQTRIARWLGVSRPTVRERLAYYKLRLGERESRTVVA